jgi:surface antigen
MVMDERNRDEQSLDATIQEAVRDAREAPGYDRLQAAIFARAEAEKLARRQFGRGASGQPGYKHLLAASLACLMIGGGLGFVAADYRASLKAAAVAELQLREHRALEKVVNEALETLVSGKQVSFANLEAGRVDSVTPIRTYQAKNGQWCREYVHETNRRGIRGKSNAVACRIGEGQWLTRLKMVNDGKKL